MNETVRLMKLAVSYLLPVRYGTLYTVRYIIYGTVVPRTRYGDPDLLLGVHAQVASRCLHTRIEISIPIYCASTPYHTTTKTLRHILTN